MSTDQINQPITEEHMTVNEFSQHFDKANQYLFANIRKLFAMFVDNIEVESEKGAKLWTGSQLSNGSFYLYPSKETGMPDKLCMSFPNSYMCEVSYKVAGIITTLYMMNYLAWQTDPNKNEILDEEKAKVIDLYYKLRDFAVEHEYCNDILSAID